MAVIFQLLLGNVVTNQDTSPIIGRSGHYNISGVSESNYRLSLDGIHGSNPSDWSGGTVQVNDLCLLTLHTNSGTGDETLPSGFVSAASSVTAIDADVGENYHLQFGKKQLDATDISNGYIQLVGVILVQRPSGLIVFRGANDIVQDSPHFIRSASLAANSVSITRPTADVAGAVAVSITNRGGGVRIHTPPAGFTNQGDFQDVTGTAGGKYAMHYATKPLTSAGQIASGTVSFDGAADMTITNVTLVVQFSQEDLGVPSITSISISPSDGDVGQVFTANVSATGDPSPTIARQWFRAGVSISGATGTTRTSVSADEGWGLKFRATATNSQGSDQEFSDPVPVYFGGESRLQLLADTHVFIYNQHGTDNPVKPCLVQHHGTGGKETGVSYNAGGFCAEHGVAAFGPWFDIGRFDSANYQKGGMSHLEAPLLASIRAHLGQPSKHVWIFGHSAGGQWVSRVAAYHNPHPLVDRYVVTNPSTHVIADDRASPFGFGSYASGATRNAAYAAYLALPLTVYLGENDNDPNDPELDTSSDGMAQGAHRRERGENAYAIAVARASVLGVPFNWEKVMAPGVAHSGTGMLDSSANATAFVPPSGNHAVRLAVNAQVGSSLKMAIDPGSSLSYSSGQTARDFMTWMPFVRGATSSSETSDPTFNGTPNGLSSSEYFSFDGGDWLTLNQSNPGWMNDIHQDGAEFTLAIWARIGVGATSQDIMGTAGVSNAARTGFRFGLGSTDLLFLTIYNNNTVVFNGSSSVTAALPGEWALYMFAFSENVSRRFARGSATGYVNATGVNTYTAPSTAGARFSLEIGAGGGGGSPLTAGTRIGPAWIWDRELTNTELEALFNATKGRFGIS